MIYLTEKQNNVTARAIDLIIERKRKSKIGGSNIDGNPSAIVLLLETIPEDGFGYRESAIIRAIAYPWAIMFFMSNDAPNIVLMKSDRPLIEKLATFIEDNTFSIMPIRQSNPFA